MNRALWVLALGILVGAATQEVYYRANCLPESNSLEGQLSWMKTELSLTDAQYARIRELHEASSPRLRALASQVSQMQSEFAAFEKARRTTDQVDFVEFARFVETRRSISRDCLDSTRQLVMATADQMTPSQRERYLGIVGAAAPETSSLGN